MEGTTHVSVLLDEVLDGLNLKPGGRYIDATLGGGGHTAAILERIGPDGRVLGIDRDPDALARTRTLLADAGDRLITAHGNFAGIRDIAEAHCFLKIDGVLMDLGVSSDQLDRGERGFSFRYDAPLDMRMDPTSGPTAAEWLAQAEETEIANVLYRYGEERQSRRIAKRLVEQRRETPWETTGQLADAVETILGGRRGKIHPATRTFQALRMAVNQELPSIEEGIAAAMELLAPGGRLAVISFHSLEDRLVKQMLNRHIGKDESLPQGGSVWRGEEPRMIRVTRKPVIAGNEECDRNPRARSAKLRIAERGP